MLLEIPSLFPGHFLTLTNIVYITGLKKKPPKTNLLHRTVNFPGLVVWQKSCSIVLSESRPNYSSNSDLSLILVMSSTQEVRNLGERSTCEALVWGWNYVLMAVHDCGQILLNASSTFSLTRSDQAVNGVRERSVTWHKSVMWARMCFSVSFFHNSESSGGFFPVLPTKRDWKKERKENKNWRAARTPVSASGQEEITAEMRTAELWCSIQIKYCKTASISEAF